MSPQILPSPFHKGQSFSELVPALLWASLPPTRARRVRSIISPSPATARRTPRTRSPPPRAHCLKIVLLYVTEKDVAHTFICMCDSSQVVARARGAADRERHDRRATLSVFELFKLFRSRHDAARGGSHQQVEPFLRFPFGNLNTTHRHQIRLDPFRDVYETRSILK